MRNDLKVFLLSCKRKYYEMLNRNGYKNITWFKNSTELVNYIKTRGLDFSEFDLAFIDNVFYKGENSDYIKEHVYSEICRNNVAYVEIDGNKYSLISSKACSTNLKEEDIFRIFSKFTYKSKNRDLNNSHNISKPNDCLSVLFIGDEAYFSFVQSYFEKQGISNICCRRIQDIDKKSLINEVEYYDLIISDYKSKFRVDEVVDSLGDKRPFVYLVNYTILKEGLSNMSVLTTADTYSKDIDRKTIITARDNNKLYQYVLDCVLENYRGINSELVANNIKEFCQIRSEYKEYIKNLNKESDNIKRKLDLIRDIEAMTRTFIDRRMKYDNKRVVDNLEVEKFDNGFSVGFILNGVMVARITFYNDSKNESDYYKEFNLEVISSKGYFMNLGARSFYDNRFYKRSDCPPVINDEDFSKVEGIYKLEKSVMRRMDNYSRNKGLELK